MSKATILDRLAGAMKTLGNREGKALTPRQRVAAAQRWNSLADISEEESTRLYDNWMNNKSVYNEPDEYLGRDEFKEFDAGLRKMGLAGKHGQRADNPFRLDWMGEPYQYEARLKNYRPLTDAQYERMLEREEEAHLRGFEDFPDDFDYMWRY